jgi:hypothetical protein
MPIDALIVGLVVLLICGAAIFYLYMRISFYERKGSMMETVIVDLRMAIDSLMHSVHSVPTPISPPPPQMDLNAEATPLESTESESIPEDKFYSSVLDLAHEDATVEESGIAAETLAEAGLVKEEGDSDLDSLNKADLLALAEKRGLRAKKSSSRNDLLTLLRRSLPVPNSEMTAGVENGSGSAAALDGSVVDLGQDATSLQ